ncbi:winged helix-turn-helix domain-containing protein [Streptomyces luomodiensis]|uniref:Winged helix-turn-helix domain-containing protein n=1 Tax=Streptomyces luomodiensis TaxID=3026192 RepID=A0ABY9V7U7_9ACTN|nr:winged helix-turn-helix domain-containing protein [Streptomyces sp. SCA4-21]WNF00869.1 winged helix-turn-helix domain-containing protein [Streptomyces sp. SCA4-21]
MAVRMHFTDEDLAQIRLAQAPDPMWEALLSMHTLQTAAAAAVFGGWRRTVRRRLRTHDAQLLQLAPPVGYSADFLTPAAGAGGLDAGLSALLSTPRRRFQHDLLELSRTGRRLPVWARSLADGDKEAVTLLARMFRSYFDTALAPWWEGIRARFDAERTVHERYLAQGDLPGLLGTLHPGLVWRGSVLVLPGLGDDRDVWLEGRGILILPSYFCWGAPTLLKDPGLPPVVVYPMAHDTAPCAVPGADGAVPVRPRSLDALVGRTRARILTTVAGHGLTTSELAHGVGVAPATVSHHATVLREAGLLSTRRIGGSVLHTLTPLGLALLGERPALGSGLVA